LKDKIIYLQSSTQRAMKTNNLIILFFYLLLIVTNGFSQHIAGTQQDRFVSGCITDAEDGDPVPAVAVFFTNTTVGTTTDMEGNYRLRIPGEGSYSLTVSHVGYQSVVKEIDPESSAVVFNVALKILELDEVKVSAGIRFRQRDINLFWSNILGKKPSTRTIQATNAEKVYYYFNPDTKILKVTCREPLEIINYETGFQIQCMLDYFTHDYNTDITSWDYKAIFTELKPDNDRQKNNWEKKRKEVYQVSIPKFIKSLYNNSLQNDGFVLMSVRPPGQIDPVQGRTDAFRKLSSRINPDDILTENSTDNSKLLNLSDQQIMLFSYGRPVKEIDIVNIPNDLRNVNGQENIKWEKSNAGVYRNLMHGEKIRIFADGTYTSRLFLSPMDLANPFLLGLCMTLPIDYNPELALVVENTNLRATGFDNIDEHFEKQLNVYPQEKIHLHTDRGVYLPGEKIWLKAYVVDARSHQYPANSQYVYVELISPSDTLVNRVMMLQNDNMFYGHLPVSPETPEGNYTLRAYTRYMENMGDGYFFKKNIRLGGNREFPLPPPIVDNEGADFDVTFFPEGGNLVEGVLCKVAFKAINSNGVPATVSGELIDEKGVEIISLNTLHAGMGVFAYTPLSGKKFYLQCRNEEGIEKRFELPQPNLQAYTITALPNDNHLFIEIQHSVGTQKIPLYLLAHCRGTVLYFSEYDNKKKTVDFDFAQFPAGVIQFVLLDERANPLAERLVFNKNNASEDVVFFTDKEIYGIREKVISTLSFNDFLTPSLSGGFGERLAHFSVAITDDKDVTVDNSVTILSTLLLSSELKGYIENPAFYLQDNPVSKAAIDLLMMTHGWRRYNIPEVIKGNPASPLIPFQVAQEVSGQVKSLLLFRPVADSEILVMMKDGGVGITSTDMNGLFVVSDLEFPDSTAIYIRALSRDGRDNVRLEIDHEKFPALICAPQSSDAEYLFSIENTMNETNPDLFVMKAGQRIKYDEDIWEIYLEDVVVTASRNERRDTPRLQFWANLSSNQTITRNDIEKYQGNNQTVGDVIQMFEPSANVMINASGVKTINLRGSTRDAGNNDRALAPALLVIDGIIQDEGTTEGGNASTQSAWRIPMSTVESIDILKGANTVAFGMRGANGVISITTRRGANTSFTEKDNHIVYTPLGYQFPVEFYAPKYETSEKRQSVIPDYRTTIFWKPDLLISDEKETSFEFYTSDFPTIYSVVIEGLTTDGKIIRQVEKIQVK